MTGVAVDIVTGFLGSGKTTLLRHVLQHGLDGRRVAVVMNEIGDVGIDGRVITGLQAVERMVELTSGCICCSVSGQFSLAVREILATARPHLILIETSGLADPAPVADQVRDAGLGLDAVVTVVDAANVQRFLRESPTASRQVEEADFLVVNKVDLVTERKLAKVEAALRRRNPRALLQRTVFGAVPTDLLFATSAGRLRAEAQTAAGASGHLEDENVEAFTFRGVAGEVVVRRCFERFLRRLPGDIYRAKGIVWLAEEERPFLFNFTCGRAELQPFPLPEGSAAGLVSQGVFIGRRARRHEARILAALRRCRPGATRLDRIRAWLGRRSQPA